MRLTSCIICIFLTLTISRISIAEQTIQVKVSDGIISGIVSKDGKINIFKGIPYAEPPVGDLRWKQPKPVKPWKDIKQTNHFSAGCMQRLVKGDKIPWTSEFLHQGNISEDCLYLNIWAKKIKHNKRLPVIIFIHGGGFVEGSGSVPIYDGENIARKGVVFVTINYRLGIFGFLAHPDLTKESGTSGNYGVYDQISAIKWVKDNIDKFGGDKENITVMGQSAGANSVMVLNASPLSKGLYKKAIMDSAPGTTISDYGINPAENIGTPLSIAENRSYEWGKKNGYATLKELREADATVLMNAFLANPPIKGVVIDGVLLPNKISEIYKNNAENKVSVLAGTNRDERGSEKDYGRWQLKDLMDYENKHYHNVQGFNRNYSALTDEDAGRIQKEILRDERMYAMKLLAEIRLKNGSKKNYLYFFEKAIPWPEHPEFGVFHSSELPYVLNNQSVMKNNWDDDDKYLERIMSTYWVNFAKNGDPNSKGLPVWTPYGINNKKVICLGSFIKMCDLLSQDKVNLISGKMK